MHGQMVRIGEILRFDGRMKSDGAAHHHLDDADNRDFVLSLPTSSFADAAKSAVVRIAVDMNMRVWPSHQAVASPTRCVHAATVDRRAASAHSLRSLIRIFAVVAKRH